MSKASREWKELLKDSGSLRKKQTLKFYRKWCRNLGRNTRKSQRN